MGNNISNTIHTWLPGVEVLTMKQAYDQMVLNETQDKYFKSCTESGPNMTAIEKIKVKPCDPPCIGTLKEMSDTALRSVPESLKPQKTIKVGVFEEGLPHTRPPSTIWFPESALRGNRRKFNETFLHECIHLHQREHESKWLAFYQDAWDFKPWTSEIPAELEGRRRLNPDTLRSPFFIWRGRYIPIAIYNNPGTADLRSVRLVFLEPSNSWSTVAPPGWHSFFGTLEPSICEHPHEMSAYFLSDNDNPFDSEAARILRSKFLTFNA